MRPGITQSPVAPCARRLTKKTKNKTKQKTQKYKPNHQQTGLPPHSALPNRGKNNKQTSSEKAAKISPYMKLTQPTGPTLEGRN